MKTSTKIFRMVISVILGFISIVLVVLIIYSPGKSEPFLGTDGTILAGSISEETFATIGGSRQGMFIKSKNKNNPVFLILHGGMPMYFLTQKYPTGLDEDYFTVVWWEQRGAGLSYISNDVLKGKTDLPDTGL